MTDIEEVVSTEETEDIPNIEDFDYTGRSTVIEFNNPDTYLDVINEETVNKNAERAMYNFYENPDIQRDIYATIQADKSNKITLLEINSGNYTNLFNICHEDNYFNKPYFALKYRNEIICTTDNNTMSSYISQIKNDWNRISEMRPFYSSKYNRFYSIKKDLDYITTKTNYNEYLSIANSVINYFLKDIDSTRDENDVVIVDKDKMVNENLYIDDATFGAISCGCSIKGVGSRTEAYNCKTFTGFNELSDNVKGILYRLLFIFQSSESQIVLAVNNFYQNITKCKYEAIERNNNITILTFTYNDTYYYFDYKNKSIVSMFILYLSIIAGDGRPMNIPIYKVIHVYPELTSESSYVFFNVDNDLPSKVSMFGGYDYYKFIDRKIKWYLTKPADSFNGIMYNGADLIDYMNIQSAAHRKMRRGGKRRNKTKKHIRKNKKSKKRYNTRKVRKTRKA